MTKEHEAKIELIYQLQKEGILRERQPVATSSGRNTAYWHYEVLHPNKLPQCLRNEYCTIGEIRW